MRNNDLTGKKFGRLTVIKRDEDRIQPSGQHKARWLCKCDCGNPNLISVDGYNLKSGHTKSCGCFNSECASKRHKQYNTYDLSGDYGIGYTNKDEEFYFDLEDYDKVSQCSWSENDNGYIITYTINRKKAIRLHRYIMNLETCSYPIIDHKNNKKFDNRKDNLRIANKQTNQINRKENKNNKSGIKGVSLDKRNNKYYARIMINGKNIFLGYFENKEEAKEARDKAEQNYFGEFAYKGEGV